MLIPLAAAPIPSNHDLFELREFDGGPEEACCHHMAQYIQRLWGIPRVDGYFNDESGRCVLHSWNVTLDGEIVETVGSQFDAFSDIGGDILRIAVGEPDYSRYVADPDSPAARWGRGLEPPRAYAPSPPC
jgi:hypothetical protein